MFKIPNTLPSKNSAVEEFADYLECECIRNDSLSIIEALKPILLLNDEILNDGIEDEGDQTMNKIDDVLAEFERRKTASNSKYPFISKNKGYTLTYSAKNINYWVYSYLLFSTRIDMSKNRMLNSIDGTQILEHLSAVVAKEYFGNRADSFVFGTAGTLTLFEDKINNLCKQIGEGHSFLNRDETTIKAQDDKLDIVVWKSFTDGSRSKLIGFGQCKTGTSWDDQATIELQPDDFCGKWLRDSPIVSPVKMFFSSQYFPLDLYSKMKNAGIVFDRFRILDYLPENINPILVREIKNWTKEAIKVDQIKSVKNNTKAQKILKKRK